MCDCELEDEILCESLGLILNDENECGICYERGSYSYLEDKKEDFYKNVKDFIIDK